MDPFGYFAADSVATNGYTDPSVNAERYNPDERARIRMAVRHLRARINPRRIFNARLLEEIMDILDPERFQRLESRIRPPPTELRPEVATARRSAVRRIQPERVTVDLTCEEESPIDLTADEELEEGEWQYE